MISAIRPLLVLGIAMIALSLLIPSGNEANVITGASLGGILAAVMGFAALRARARRRTGGG